MKLCITILFIYKWIGINASSENSTFIYTNEMTAQCKEHVCRLGYVYDTYYMISDNVRSPSNPDTVAFEMHIGIQAASNGHILLSPVLRPTSLDPVYEIVVGGGGNTFTELRRNLRRNAKTSSKTVGILSAQKIRGFYIKISKDGLLEFGKEGESLPIIHFYDVDPLDIKYFSFASWNGVDAKFFYDCPAPGKESNNTVTAKNSTEIEPKLSPSDQLKKTMLLGHSSIFAPESNMTVQMGIMVTSVRYDAFESKITAGLAFVTSWTDRSMAWNPDKFNGIIKVNFRQSQIWRPTFLVYNSNTMNQLDANNAGLIAMDFSGQATFHFRATVESWCVTYDPSLNKWPLDEYSCSIVIQPWEAHEVITTELLDADDKRMKIFTDIDDIVKNEWDVKWKPHVVKPDNWKKIYPNSNNETNQSDRILVYLSLQRKAVSYNIAFYTPLVVLAIFLLMSFWSEPLKMSRVWSYTACTMIICIGLCYIDYLMPCHTVPSLLVLYIAVLGGVLFALMLQVVLMMPLMKILCATQPMQTLLTSSYFRTIFFLPPMTVSKNYSSLNQAYTSQDEDDDSGVIITPRNSNIEEMEADKKASYGEPVELAEACDKLMFFVYTLGFAVMLALHF